MGQIKKIVFIRHCKAEMGGVDHERKLDEDGIAQSISLSKKLQKLILNKVTVYSSPFVRAVESIKPYLKDNPNANLIEETSLEEIDHGKSPDLSKHQIIEKMWNDENFSIEGHKSQKDHFQTVQPFLEKIIDNFYKNNDDLILITHGNLLGMILKFYFKKDFKFENWKKMSMPDVYILEFDEKNVSSEFIRDIDKINKLYYIG
tara:strand:+ start:221 stop:829 length:609 start_codon:yes stop_codon:yes gene_type:complete